MRMSQSSSEDPKIGKLNWSVEYRTCCVLASVTLPVSGTVADMYVRTCYVWTSQWQEAFKANTLLNAPAMRMCVLIEACNFGASFW